MSRYCLLEIERRNEVDARFQIVAVFVEEEQVELVDAYAYSIDKLQDRGRFFISPMEQVYAGQVIGEHTRQNDITVNVTKAKQLTNMRASGSDDKTSIAPPKVFTLEEALEYIQGDEYVEVTPHSMRLRKILLDENDRKRAAK